MKIIIFSICIILFFGCSDNNKHKSFSGERQFRTTEPSKLFFNNIRSAYYYRSRKPNTTIDIYQIRKFSRTDKRPILYPLIVNNWMQDEAYLFLEKNAYPNFSDPIIIKAEKDTLSEIFKIDVFTKVNQYEFATKIYESLKEGKSLFLKTKEENFVPIFESYDDKSNFMMTMRDYYRLIELQ